MRQGEPPTPFWALTKIRPGNEAEQRKSAAFPVQILFWHPVSVHIAKNITLDFLPSDGDDATSDGKPHPE